MSSEKAQDKELGDTSAAAAPPAPTVESVPEPADKPTSPAPSTAINTALPPSTSASPAPAQNAGLTTEPPARPLTPNSQARATLQEAFPAIDASVIRAVLIASGGRVEPAFNALLTMSDPNAADDEMPPPPPPRPRSRSPNAALQSQLESDAELAARLQREFDAQEMRTQRQGRGGAGNYRQEPGNPPLPQRRQRRQDITDSDEEYYRDDDRDHSFFDDDLPVIKDNIKKGFIETQTKVNSWLNEFKRRIDGDDDEERTHAPPPGRSSSQYARSGSRRSYDSPSRRSTERYDADPAILNDDFTHLALHDNTGDASSSSRRPKANPNLFQPTATSGSGRKVSFDDRPTSIPPPNEDDLYSKPRTGSPAAPGGSASTSKWKPLQNMEPVPMDRDPFSLQDSDDEKDGLMKEGEEEEEEKKKKAAAEASKANASIGVSGPQEEGVTK